MPQIIFLPHPELCPDGAALEAPAGETVLDVALKNGISIPHACEKSCACTTCHLVIREGFDSLDESDELEDDMLDKAWGLESESRLGCQAVIRDEDLVVEIPKYNLNIVNEEHQFLINENFLKAAVFTAAFLFKRLYKYVAATLRRVFK